MATRISVDYEYNADVWWAALRELAADRIPGALQPILCDRDDEVTVPDDEAPALRAWCATLPGWADGPAFAPTALVFNEDD